MPRQTASVLWSTAASTPAGGRLVTTQKLLVLLTITALVLAGCTTPGLAPVDDAAPAPDAATVTGCPTPTPQSDLVLEQNDGTAGQSLQEPATQEDAMTAGEQNNVPSLAEREAMLDRVNQGPARPGVELEGSGVPPDPNLGLQPGATDVDAAVPVSETTNLDASGATPTPCP